MTKRIVMIGNAGSGKTVLSAQLFAALKIKGLNTELVTEFVRSDLHANGPMTSIWEQYRTRFHQQQIEDAIPITVDYVVTDSGTLTPYFYANLYADHTDPRQRLVLSDMTKYLLDDLYLKRYTYVFFIPMAKTYEANPHILTDGTRYQTREEIETLEMNMSLVFTRLYRVDNIYVLNGPLADRVNTVLKIIGVSSK